MEVSAEFADKIDFENDRRFRRFVFGQGTVIPKWALSQIVSALPDDALLFHADFDFRIGQCNLCFWSSVFDHVPLGYDVPTFTGWIDNEARKAGISS